MKQLEQRIDPDVESRKEQLIKEIQEAHQDWENANRFFQYAYGKDQVDYAIYALVSAEKRYEMLLRAAKRMTGNWPMWRGEFK